MDMYKMPQRAMCNQRAFDQRAFAARSRSAGFTLIEMIAVLVLIGIVMAIVGGRVMQNFQSGEYKAGVASVHSLEMKVQAYMLDNGSAPQSLNDLITRPGNASNWNGPYAKPGDLKDPFQHPFFYKAPGDHGEFDIIFYGKDGAAGGDTLNKDYGNWQ
jgi:general secretion pathway protein G